MPLLHDHRICGCSHAHSHSDFASKDAPANYPPDLRLEPVHSEIKLHVDLDAQRASGQVTHTVAVHQQGVPALILDAVDLIIERVSDEGGAFRLSVDGREIVSLPVEQLQPDAGQGEFVTTDPAIVRRVLDAMKAGTMLGLDYKGEAGTYRSEIMLEGFRGSLFYIDDVQDRRGRTDALFAVGQTVPEGAGSKDIQSLDDIPMSIRADFTAESGRCTEAFYPDDIGRYDGFDITHEEVRFVLVPCSSGGAYNQPYALYRGYESGILTRISFPDVEEGKPSISETADNVDFDPVTGIMTAFSKDIGLGYCGLWYKWRVTTEGQLMLLERRAWYECDGSRTEPEDFPLEWPVDGQTQEDTAPSTDE